MKNSGNLQVTTPGDREIVMTRVFNAPRQLVFDAMTRPELLRRWFDGPPGWSLVVCEFEARVGGAYRFAWRGPDGTEMGVRGVCREFDPPARMASTEKFDQAWYPGEAVSTVQLVEQDGKTTLTLTIVYESREIRDAVLKSPMEDGMAYGYDKLAALLTAVLAEGEK